MCYKQWTSKCSALRSCWWWWGENVPVPSLMGRTQQVNDTSNQNVFSLNFTRNCSSFFSLARVYVQYQSLSLGEDSATNQAWLPWKSQCSGLFCEWWNTNFCFNHDCTELNWTSHFKALLQTLPEHCSSLQLAPAESSRSCWAGGEGSHLHMLLALSPAESCFRGNAAEWAGSFPMNSISSCPIIGKVCLERAKIQNKYMAVSDTDSLSAPTLLISGGTLGFVWGSWCSQDWTTLNNASLELF